MFVVYDDVSSQNDEVNFVVRLSYCVLDLKCYMYCMYNTIYNFSDDTYTNI